MTPLDTQLSNTAPQFQYVVLQIKLQLIKHQVGEDDNKEGAFGQCKLQLYKQVVW